MARLTKQEKVVKFNYELKRFQSSMEEYTKYLQAAQIAEHRKNTTEKNDQGLSTEAKAKTIAQWADYQIKSTNEANDKMKQAIESFDNMKDLLK